MATEKELARYGYSGFGEKPKEPRKGITGLETAGYKGFGEKLGKGAPENKALYLEDLESKTKAELETLAELRGLDVEGTGFNGAVLKSDLIEALKAAG
jgi:hypothetical protein